MRPKGTNRIIRTSREGWILVDISTAKHPDAAMHIDKEDWDYVQLLNSGRVCAVELHNIIYARCFFFKKQYLIHRLLLPNSKLIDHKNKNGLDNRRNNIWSCTYSQNNMNRVFKLKAVA